MASQIHMAGSTWIRVSRGSMHGEADPGQMAVTLAG